MDDDAKYPGPFHQRSDPAVEPEDAAAESMGESMDQDTTTTTTAALHTGAPQRQTQRGLRSTESTKKRNANKKNKRRTRQATEAGGTPTE